MNDLIKEKLNGYGVALRFITPLLVAIIAWNAKEMLSDIKYIKNNMVYKSEYANDKEMLAMILNKIDDRVREIEKDDGHK